MTIRVERTGNSDVSVGSTVTVGDGVRVGSGEGVSDCVGVNSTGVVVNKTLAAFTGVDEHPLSMIAASVRRIIVENRAFFFTVPMIGTSFKMP
jgi:hypothetical protein